MDSSKPMSKKEMKQMKRLAELERANLDKRQSTLKWIIIGVGSFLFLSLFTFIIILSKQNNSSSKVTLNSSGWVRGDPNSKVTMVEFGDFQCPACKAYEPVVASVMKDYQGKVKLLFKHFPLKSAHKNAQAAAMAAEAAGAQGKFWEMHDILYAKQDEWAEAPDPTDKFVSFATAFQLDIDKFKTDLKDSTANTKIQNQEDEGIAVGVNSTPTFFINGRQIEAPAQYVDFKKIIDEELKK